MTQKDIYKGDLKTQLNLLHKDYEKLKSVKAIEKEFQDCQEANYHSECSLLMAIHYGTKEDAEMIKNLIVAQTKKLAPNPAYMRRIKMTSEFYEKHRLVLSKCK